ncbi:hypothetical protein TNCV_3387891 [Trichonephila clavipes]|nr:hypothetical protein TNCV_3387891 [Trichonephila clavipes]
MQVSSGTMNNFSPNEPSWSFNGVLLEVTGTWHSPYSNPIVRVHYFVRGGFVGYRSRASSKHLSSHLPVGSLDSSGGSNRGCAGSEIARVGVESTKKPTPDVVVVFET